MAVELDAFADDILNPDALQDCPFVNSGLQYIWEDERKRRTLAGMEAPESSVPPLLPRPFYQTPGERDFLKRLHNKCKQLCSGNSGLMFGSQFSQQLNDDMNMSILQGENMNMGHEYHQKCTAGLEVCVYCRFGGVT